MDGNYDKKELLTRLAVCAIIAIAVCYGGEKLLPSLHHPMADNLRPWLEKNKMQAIVLVAAVIFGVSLKVRPLKPAEECYEPCDDAYEPVETCE
ncbi:MAG: hypothetical protein LIO58_08380 [Oscillospiraceae bacterium]|nr:hypothetical protein [Oscillospiraceae bacterium]